jgi:hypothetical protein
VGRLQPLDGHDPKIFIAKAPTRVMNPSLPQKIIDRAMERDEAAARADYLAEFRADIAAFVDRDIVQGLIIPDRHEVLPSLHNRTYFAFVDPAGGGGGDSMTLAVAHSENEVTILDCLREIRPPFSPMSAIVELAKVAKSYELIEVNGDRYSGTFASEQFAANGLGYQFSERSKSELYVELLPLLNSGKVELLDNKRLIDQLCVSERRAARGTGRDIVDHPSGPNAHDDCINAAAGALVMASGKLSNAQVWERFGDKAQDWIFEMLQRQAGYGY